MHLIWSGLGFLVGLITFGCLVATEFLVEAAYHDDRYYQANGWPKFLGFAIAAAIVAIVGRRLKRRQGRVLIDPETGSEVIVNPRHTFFFIRVDRWAPILLVLGVLFSFVTE